MATIIIKSQRTFIGQIYSEYYKLTLNDGVLEEMEMTTQEAKDYIREHNLPEIHRIDHNNIIWGDDSFKLELPESLKKSLCD